MLPGHCSVFCFIILCQPSIMTLSRTSCRHPCTAIPTLTAAPAAPLTCLNPLPQPYCSWASQPRTCSPIIHALPQCTAAVLTRLLTCAAPAAPASTLCLNLCPNLCPAARPHSLAPALPTSMQRSPRALSYTYVPAVLAAPPTMPNTPALRLNPPPCSLLPAHPTIT
jgi:hypothetical protein